MPTDRAQPEIDSLLHTYGAASFMAREGEYDLALKLLRKALEKAHLDRHVGRTVDVGQDAALAEMERRLMAEYAACRIKLEEGRKPLIQTLAKTGAMCATIALTFIICFWFAMSRLDAVIARPVDKVVSVLDGAVKAELPRVTNKVLDIVPEMSAQMDKQMEKISMRMSAYLEKKVDQALDERIGAIVDEKLKAREGGKQ